MTVSGAWSRCRRAQQPKSQRFGRWQQVLADALDQNLATGVRAAVADHLGRVPTRAELTAARRAAHSLAALGRAQVLHVPGADADSGNRNYLVLAKPNVIMNDIRLHGLGVAGSDAAGRKSPPQPRPKRTESQTLAAECGRWCPTNPRRWLGQQIGRRCCSLSARWRSFRRSGDASIDASDGITKTDQMVARARGCPDGNPPGRPRSRQQCRVRCVGNGRHLHSPALWPIARSQPMESQRPQGWDRLGTRGRSPRGLEEPPDPSQVHTCRSVLAFVAASPPRP
jgi:hypothetical protein